MPEETRDTGTVPGLYQALQNYTSSSGMDSRNCHDNVKKWKLFRVTGPLWGESTGHRWIPLTKVQWRGALMFSLICAWPVPGLLGSPMVTSSNGNIFRVTGPLWGESAGHRWIPFTKASDAELWCFLWSALEQTTEQTIKTPVIETPLRPLWRHCNGTLDICYCKKSFQWAMTQTKAFVIPVCNRVC